MFRRCSGKMKLMWMLSGVVFLVASGYSGFVGFEDSGSTEVDIPSCSSVELDLQNACDKSLMLDTNEEVPGFAMSFIDIEVVAEWDVPDAWIGVVDANESSKCSETANGFLLCETEDLEFYAGGPDSQGTITWQIEEGSYRFVAGSSVVSSGETTQIDYAYTVQASMGVFSALGLIGAGMCGWSFTED